MDDALATEYDRDIMWILQNLKKMHILAAQCHSATMLDSIDYGLHRLYKGLFNIILHLIIKVLSAKEEEKKVI